MQFSIYVTEETHKKVMADAKKGSRSVCKQYAWIVEKHYEDKV